MKILTTIRGALTPAKPKKVEKTETTNNEPIAAVEKKEDAAVEELF